MEFEDIGIHKDNNKFWAGYRIGEPKTFKFMYVYKDGETHASCRDGDPNGGWFDSKKEAEKAVRLFIKKQNKPTRGIIATWLYNNTNF